MFRPCILPTIIYSSWPRIHILNNVFYVDLNCLVESFWVMSCRFWGTNFRNYKLKKIIRFTQSLIDESEKEDDSIGGQMYSNYLALGVFVANELDGWQKKLSFNKNFTVTAFSQAFWNKLHQLKSTLMETSRDRPWMEKSSTHWFLSHDLWIQWWRLGEWPW